jgi:hypothetical protein
LNRPTSSFVVPDTSWRLLLMRTSDHNTVVLLRLLLGLADLGIIEGGLIVATILRVLRFGRIDGVLAFGRPLQVHDIIGFPGADQAHGLRVEGESLDDMQLVSMRNAPVDGARLKTHCIDDQRVVFPASDRVTDARATCRRARLRCRSHPPLRCPAPSPIRSSRATPRPRRSVLPPSASGRGRPPCHRGAGLTRIEIRHHETAVGEGGDRIDSDGIRRDHAADPCNGRRR